MKLAVFSDSHGNVQTMWNIVDLERPDAIIHLGDSVRDAEELERMIGNITVCIVPGNNDFYCDEAKEKSVRFDGLSLFLCHGHTVSVKMSLLPLATHAKKEQCQAALFGHTHRPFNEVRHGVRLFNPGSIRDGCSYGIIRTGAEPSFEIRKI